MTVDDVLDESWRTGNADWDKWLESEGSDEDKQTVAGLNKRLKQVRSLYSEAVHGTADHPAAEQPITDTATYIGQNGERVTGSAPHSGYTVVPGVNGQPKYSFVIDARSPISPAQLKSEQQTRDFFASKHGAVTTRDQEWAQLFPNSAATRTVTPQPAQAPAAPLLPPAYQTVGNAGRDYGNGTVFSPFGTVSRTSAPAFTPNADMTLQPPSALKVASPIPNGVDWPTLPPSPLDQKDRDRYASL
jgi:hypothetical protein